MFWFWFFDSSTYPTSGAFLPNFLFCSLSLTVGFWRPNPFPGIPSILQACAHLSKPMFPTTGTALDVTYNPSASETSLRGYGFSTR
ncbi:hypothetical protein B0H14DRAFT_2860151, partial [Mycena olivaceomarginata]